jgi:hypothetical protein
LLTVKMPFVGSETVNTAVESGMLRPLAWSVVEPSLRVVTWAVVVVDPAAKVAVAGTVATSVFDELRFTLRPPAGAAPESVRVTLCGPNEVAVSVGCGHPTVAAIVTVWLEFVYPGADALIVVEPTLTPFTLGCVAGVVCPAAIVTVAGVTVALLGSALLKVTVTPPAGAATGSVTVKVAGPARGAVTPEGNPIGPAVTTVIDAVASGMKVVALAWIVADPSATAVTVTVAVVAPLANVTVAGTVATAELLELVLTISPAAGAGADSVRVRDFVLRPVMVAVAGVKVTDAFTCAAVDAEV